MRFEFEQGRGRTRLYCDEHLKPSTRKKWKQEKWTPRHQATTKTSPQPAPAAPAAASPEKPPAVWRAPAYRQEKATAVDRSDGVRLVTSTSETNYTDAEAEFIRAVDQFKRAHRRPFPSLVELLGVAYSLGYRKVTT